MLQIINPFAIVSVGRFARKTLPVALPLPQLPLIVVTVFVVYEHSLLLPAIIQDKRRVLRQWRKR